MVALTARGNATFRPVKKNGNSDFQMISRAIARLAGAGNARHVDQALIDGADAREGGDEDDVEHHQRHHHELRQVADAEPENQPRRQRVFRECPSRP